jgi:Arc/MetJ-type ribon-helix-helix transcriptional regulator
MKVSVSLSNEDIATLDEYIRTSGAATRSAAVQQAIKLLREVALEDDYAEAFQDWSESEDASVWESTVGDGLAHAPR